MDITAADERAQHNLALLGTHRKGVLFFEQDTQSCERLLALYSSQSKINSTAVQKAVQRSVKN
ncbi:MAG: hypothetical protein K2Q15_03220 [Burkholderiales bacterium]|jgi:hypothetical protein|nr:hypothetical protein [Burkholderiales bacterium]MCX7208276.1 hypothetical protein [Pseudomonadota bacterium]